MSRIKRIHFKIRTDGDVISPAAQTDEWLPVLRLLNREHASRFTLNEVKFSDPVDLGKVEYDASGRRRHLTATKLRFMDTDRAETIVYHRLRLEDAILQPVVKQGSRAAMLNAIMERYQLDIKPEYFLIQESEDDQGRRFLKVSADDNHPTWVGELYFEIKDNLP